MIYWILFFNSKFTCIHYYNFPKRNNKFLVIHIYTDVVFILLFISFLHLPTPFYLNNLYMGSSISKVSCGDITMHKKNLRSTNRRPTIRIDKSKIGVPTDFRASMHNLYSMISYTNMFLYI